MPMIDRTVVVTGGTGALGTAVVARLLQDRANVVVPVLERETPHRFPFAGHERVTLVHGVELGDERQVVDFYAAVPSLWASIQIAGGFTMAPLTKTSADEFERMWRMNVASCFLCCREAVARMRMRAAHEPGGRLVNVAARPALIPTAGMVAYSTAKAGVVALTRALAEELADEEIWVNAIAPSIIDTRANREAMPDADHTRWPKPEALAEQIVGLVSPGNACVRGAVLTAYGRA
jgi:NAD(P)-dependent dehydrogenase (short-subunit alcohol dehydrogenase family)